jgi:hypothetical protein
MVAVLRVVARVPGAGGEVTAPLPGSGVDKFRPPFLENFVISIRKEHSALAYALFGAELVTAPVVPSACSLSGAGWAVSADGARWPIRSARPPGWLRQNL